MTAQPIAPGHSSAAAIATGLCSERNVTAIEADEADEADEWRFCTTKIAGPVKTSAAMPANDQGEATRECATPRASAAAGLAGMRAKT